MWKFEKISLTYAIIQARLGSTRLPGKVLADIHGKPMIWWMLQRLYCCQTLSGIVLATTDLDADDKLVDWMQDNTDIPVFRGSKDDLVDRYYACAKSVQAETIVRITADDPLKDASIIDRAVSMFRTGSFDYVSNCINPTYPEGLDVEVFSFQALERVWKESKLASDREHLTTYMVNNPEQFKLGNFEYHLDLSSWRWTVDKQPDLDLMRAIFGEFKSTPEIHFEDVISHLDKRPDLVLLNQGTVRMEGYKKSVELERYKND